MNNLIKNFTLTATTVVTLATWGCDEKKDMIARVSSVELNKKTVALQVGEKEALTATISPSNAHNKKVSWSSSDNSVAAVENGAVTALKAGSATVTATTEDGSKTAAAAITVSDTQPTHVAVSGVSLDRNSLALAVGGSATLSAAVAPQDASNKKVSWSSSNQSIAMVQDGLVTALKAGSATVTVATEDGAKTAAATVAVSAPPVAVSGVSVGRNSLALTVGDTVTLSAAVAPQDASNKKVSWSSSDHSVAVVHEGGFVTALTAGSATITVTTEDGAKTAATAVTVSSPHVAVRGISLDKSALTLVVGDIETLSATVTPQDASNKKVSWSSSDINIATALDGVVTALSAGVATITVTTQDGAKAATAAVTVSGSQTTSNLRLNFQRLSINQGGAFMLSIIAGVPGAFTWKSDAENIAKVDASGYVSGISPGLAKITVQSSNGDMAQASVLITKDLDSNQPDVIKRFVYGGHTYFLMNDERTWNAAALRALENGGHLAFIESANEQKEIETIFNDELITLLGGKTADDGGDVPYVWIGCTDRVKEGSWVWDNGNGATADDPAFWGAGASRNHYNYWGKGGEPDNYHDALYIISGKGVGQDYGAIGLAHWPKGNRFEWNDLAGGNTNRYLIEIDYAAN